VGTLKTMQRPCSTLLGYSGTDMMALDMWLDTDKKLSGYWFNDGV
jgi:hypothetical protein